MSPESAGSMGLGAPLGEPDDRDPDWPDDWPDEDQPSGPGMTQPPRPARAGGPPGRPRALAVTAVAITALALGAGTALAVTKGLSASSTPSSPPAAAGPSFAAPGSSNGNGNGGQIPAGGGTSGTEQIFIGGRVLAVSDSSITIGGPGREITAAITGSTRVTGRVDGIQGVKNGDLVTAQITKSGGAATVVALQDPAEPPSGGSVP